MTPEQMQAVLTAATAGDQATLQGIIVTIENQARAGASDKLSGFEEAIAPIKAKERELVAKLKTEQELARTQAEQIVALQRTAEDEAAKAASAAAGVDHDQVEKLAEERAQAKYQAKVREWSEQNEKLKELSEGAAADRDLLVEKFRTSLIDHELYKAAPGVDAMLWPMFRSAAEPHFQPRQNGDGEWWKEDSPGFDLIDPVTKTRLMNDEAEPMTPSDLVKARKAGEWGVFFPPTGQGGGASTPAANDGQTRLAWDADPGQFMDRVLGG